MRLSETLKLWVSMIKHSYQEAQLTLLILNLTCISPSFKRYYNVMLFCCKITCVAIYALLVSNFWAGNGAGVQKKTNMRYVQCTLCMRALGKWKLNTNQMEWLQVVAPPWKISQEGSAGCDQIFSYFCSDRILWNMKNTIGARTNQGWKQRQRTVL